MPLPYGPFDIIYADPNWCYPSPDFGCGVQARYKGGTATHAEIAAVPVSSIVARDAYLFMWCTWPQLFRDKDNSAFSVMEAWGFEYKTCAFLWVKTNKVNGKPWFGRGFYMKHNSEFCLLGVRGKPWKLTDAISQICEAPADFAPYEVWAPITRHSEKPAEVRRKIVEFCGDRPRLEMYSRHTNPGWQVWGDELPTHRQGDLLEESLESC